MKTLTTLLTTVFLLFSAGNSVFAKEYPYANPGMGIGASSALVKAMKSAQSDMLSGGQRAKLIIAQMRDGESTVRNVEHLDTLYYITDQNFSPIKNEEFLLMFEVSKTSDKLSLLRYLPVWGIWVGATDYTPSDLPDMDLQWAWRQIKAEIDAHPGDAANPQISSVGVSKAVVPGLPYIVGFNVYPPSNPTLPEGMCDQWIYNLSQDLIYYGMPAPCHFDLDNYDLYDGGIHGSIYINP
jgi:hypothetical protein